MNMENTLFDDRLAPEIGDVLNGEDWVGGEGAGVSAARPPLRWTILVIRIAVR